MRLLTYLEHLSPSTLKKIAEEHGKRLEDKRPDELVNYLEHWLIQPSTIKIMIQQMTKQEKEVLSFFIYQIPNQMFYYRKLDRISGTISREDFEYGIIKLRRKGILFTLRRSWGEMAFIMPEDLFQAWHWFFFSDILEKQKEIAITNIYPDEKLVGNIEEDLFSVLTYITLEEVPITQKGTIHKRHITKIADLLMLDHHRLTHFPFKQKRCSNDSPRHVTVLLELAFAIGLIEQVDVLIVTKKADAWHQMEPLTKRKYLISWVRSLFNATDVFYYHIFYFLFHLPADKWFSFSDIVHNLAQAFKRPIDKENIDRAMMEILLPLEGFGWIEKTDDQTLGCLIRRKENKEETYQIYAQPNYEILVPQTFSHSLRLMMERFTVLEKRDQMNRYRLSKESILKGLENGMSIQDIISFLEKYSVIPIAKNIKVTLTDWAKNYGTITFMDVRILTCQTEAIAAHLKKEPLLKDWIIGEIDSSHLIVRREQFQERLQTLFQLGYYPKKQLWSEELLKNRDIVQEDQPFELFRYNEYRVENIFPTLPNSL